MNLVTEKETDRRELPIWTLCLLLSMHEAGRELLLRTKKKLKLILVYSKCSRVW